MRLLWFQICKFQTLGDKYPGYSGEHYLEMNTWNLVDAKWTLVLVMASWPHPSNHHVNQFSLRSPTLYGITRQQIRSWPDDLTNELSHEIYICVTHSNDAEMNWYFTICKYTSWVSCIMIQDWYCLLQIWTFYMWVILCVLHVPGDYTLGLILGFRPTNERRRYIVTTSLIGWAHA